MDHLLADSLFQCDRATKSRLRAENQQIEEEHDYPFDSLKHINPISINKDPVKMFLRTSNDFYRVEDTEMHQVYRSKSGYEAYRRTEYRRLKGLFENDAER